MVSFLRPTLAPFPETLENAASPPPDAALDDEAAQLVRALNEGATPLTWLVASGKVSLVRLVLAHGVSPEEPEHSHLLRSENIVCLSVGFGAR